MPYEHPASKMSQPRQQNIEPMYNHYNIEEERKKEKSFIKNSIHFWSNQYEKYICKKCIDVVKILRKILVFYLIFNVRKWAIQIELKWIIIRIILYIIKIYSLDSQRG